MTEKEKQAAADQVAADNEMLNNPAIRRVTLGKAQGLKNEPNKMPDANVPATPAPDQELNWVQKMTKQIHDYLTRKKKENK
jgi:hypothetical protein